MKRLISGVGLWKPPRFKGISIRIIAKLQAAIRYWKAHGFRAFLKRSLVTLSRFGLSNISQQTELEEKKVAVLLTLPFFTVPTRGPRLNIVTNTFGVETLFGGLTPALVLSALLAERWKADLRIITYTEQPHKNIFNDLIKLNNIPLSRNVDFSHISGTKTNTELPVGKDEYFITTSWQTTRAVMNTFTEERIIYLLCDNEGTLHQAADQRLLYSETLENPQIRFITDTRLLYEHLISEGYENFRHQGLWFEPACPSNIFFPIQNNHKSKHNFFFYVRSDDLDLFDLGLKVIDSAISAKIIDPDIWDVYFVGRDIPGERIPGSYIPLFLQNSSLLGYADLIRRMDVGLCLMRTPHPGYPLLHLAASGGVAITNKFGNKQNLDSYSRNIICKELELHAIVTGIEDAIALAFDDARKINFQNNRILDDWKSSFEELIPILDR